MDGAVGRVGLGLVARLVDRPVADLLVLLDHRLVLTVLVTTARAALLRGDARPGYRQIPQCPACDGVADPASRTTASSQTPNDFLMADSPAVHVVVADSMRVRTRSRAYVNCATMGGLGNRRLARFAPTNRRPGTGGTAHSRATAPCSRDGTAARPRASGCDRLRRDCDGGRHRLAMPRRRRIAGRFMTTAPVLDREEYIEQAYFFRASASGSPTTCRPRTSSPRLHEELLTTTRLPYAVQFLAAEIKHTGPARQRVREAAALLHPFQAFVIRQAEEEKQRFPMADGAAGAGTRGRVPGRAADQPGLFVYQFETIARNRLGYIDGLAAMAADPLYDADWRATSTSSAGRSATSTSRDLVYLRSELYVTEQRRANPAYEPSRAAALRREGGEDRQGQPRPRPAVPVRRAAAATRLPRGAAVTQRDDGKTRSWSKIETKLRELETRLKLAEGELRGNIDLSQFGKPDC